MRLKLVTLAGVVAVSLPAVAAAQAQPSAQKTAPATKAQTPAQTKTAPATTTQTTTSTTPEETATPQSTTPGQSQTSPGEASQLTPAVTGQTPAGQSVPNQAADQAATGAQAAQITKATAADIKAGVSVYDQKGGLVGKIVSSSAKGAVLDTGTVKATIPASSFAKSDKGLVIGMTKSEIDAAAKPATTKAAKTTKKPKE
jgi:hypothetical protein